MFRYFLALFVFVLSTQTFSEESDSLHQKSPKVLVLIIASDDQKVYFELQKVWRAYMNSDPEHFEVYFIRGNPELSSPYAIRGNDLFVKSEENYVPGIVNKTILSMEALLPRLSEFDYVLRTNLSSFYSFSRLLDFIKTLPTENCYCGSHLHIPGEWIPQFGLTHFVSGAGILISSDLAKMLVREKESIFALNTGLPDDVLLGYFFQNWGVPIINAQRVDIPTWEHWEMLQDNIQDTSFHFRAKQTYHPRTAEDSWEDEVHINHELLKLFYPSLSMIN